jgi:hypothetical protein
MLRTLLATAAAAALMASAGAAHAVILRYEAILSGLEESPPNPSPATGEAFLTIDDVADTMRVQASFTGLLGTTTASHVHCCTAAPDTGVAPVATMTPAFTGFPLGVTSGSLDHTFDLTLTSTYNAPFVTAHGGTAAGAEAAFLAGLGAGEAYFNIHTTAVPGGEIRGFLTAIPEPAAWSLMIAGFGLTGAALRRRAVRPAAT